MSVIHLSEIEIQNYLDTQSNKERVENHILSCEDCALQIAEYEAFYLELSVADTPQLSPDFAMNTMNLVRQETILADNKGFYLYSLLGLVFAFYLFRYYVGFTFTMPQLSTPQLTNVFADWSVVHTISGFYQSSPAIANNLLLAGAMLLFVGLIDAVLSRKALQKVSCLSI